MPDSEAKEGQDVARVPRLSRSIAQLASFVLVGLSVFWLMGVAPIGFHPGDISFLSVTERIMGGYAFSSEALDQLDKSASIALTRDACVPTELKALSLIRLARVEAAIDAHNSDAALARMSELTNVVLLNIYCSPYQSTAWTILAVSEYLVNGPTPRLNALIDLSQRTGPFEGWALLRRLELLMRLWPNLTPEQMALAKEEVRLAIVSDLHEILVRLYLTASPEEKSFLRNILSEASQYDQILISRLVHQQDGDIDLPLGAQLGSRPWER